MNDLTLRCRVATVWAASVFLGSALVQADVFEDLSAELANLRQANQLLNRGVIWEDRNLFVSEPIFEHDGKLLAADSAAFPHAPLTWEWCQRYDLPIEQALLPSLDSDDDGYSHAEEFLAGTSPVDRMSKPSPVVKWRYDGLAPSGVALEVRGAVDLRRRLQVDLHTAKGRGTLVVAVGDTLRVAGQRWRVVAFREAVRPREDLPDLMEDVSEVTLENGDGERARLLRGKRWALPSGEALLHDRSSANNWRVRQGESVTVAIAPDEPFDVADFDANGVDLRDVNGKVTRVKRSDVGE